MRKQTASTPVPDSAGTCAGLCAGCFCKKPNEFNDVPDVPGFKATHPHACARIRERSNCNCFSPSHGYIPRHIRHIRHIVVFQRKNGKEGGTVNGTHHKHPAQPVSAAHQAPKTIRCSEENAAQFQQLVKTDPELLALVQGLQAQGVFPGLRAMSITLTGGAAQQALGLAAWPAAPSQEAPTC